MPPGLAPHIQRAFHAFSPAIENMRVNHSGTDVFVVKQLLHRADIITILQEMGGPPEAVKLRCDEMYDNQWV